MKALEALEQLVLDIAAAVPTEEVEVHGWKLLISVPSIWARDEALKNSMGLDGWSFLFIYRRWLAVHCIQKLTKPSGEIVEFPQNLIYRSEDGESKENSISLVVAKLFVMLPYPVLDHIYNRLMALKSQYVKDCDYPEDEGLLSLQTSMDTLLKEAAKRAENKPMKEPEETGHPDVTPDVTPDISPNAKP